MVAFTSSMTALLAFVMSATLVSAGPFPRSRQPIPGEANHLAFDERTNTIIAFKRDGTQLGVFDTILDDSHHVARDDSPCQALSADDAQKLPGWKTLEDTAKKNWGSGSWNIVTNPDDYKDQPAQICASSDPIKITADAKASCSDSTQTTGGSLVGSNGSVTLTKSEGTNYASTNTVTKESSIAVGAKFGAKITIEKVLEIGEEVSMTTTFTNSLSSSTTSSQNNQQTSSVTQNASSGQKCHLEFKTHACTLEGNGKARFVADGWVWFNYNDKTHDHYKWALNIASTLTNQDDRSTFMEFKAAVKSTTNSDYNGKCE